MVITLDFDSGISGSSPDSPAKSRDMMKLLKVAGLVLAGMSAVTLACSSSFKHDLLLKAPLPIVDFERIQTIKIQDLSVNSRQIWFDRSFLNGKVIQTEDQLYNAVMDNFYLYEQELTDTWKVQDHELLMTLYFMNVTAHLWGYGNPNKVKEVGCVFKNEDHPGGIFNPEEPMSKHIPQMVASRIGCCTDHANMLHMLLTKAGIKNRFMMNPGHVFNEAFIGGKWQAFDGTTNMWWHDSWDKVQNAGLTTPVYVTMFPDVGTVYGHPYYRPFLAIFRHYMLLEAVYKMAKDIKHPDRI